MQNITKANPNCLSGQQVEVVGLAQEGEFMAAGKTKEQAANSLAYEIIEILCG